jgi:hypothetical protein
MSTRRVLVGFVGLSMLLATGLPASAHEAAERYIPVGQSPSLSGRYTVIGMIETIDARQQTLTIAGAGRTWSATITGRTKIWLDRSGLRLTNLTGTFADLKPGLTVEVKHEGPERRSTGPAEWVKVQIPSP